MGKTIYLINPYLYDIIIIGCDSVTKEEKTNSIMEIRQLKGKRNSIIQQLEKLGRQLEKIEKKSEYQFEYFICDWRKLQEQISKLHKSLYVIEKTLELYSLNPICTNDFIDLYNDPEYDNSYLVCSHGKKEFIGKLSFGDSFFADNISYFIYEKYRNKGLGFQSVCLFLEYLNSKGIETATVHVAKTNLPSLRIVEKLKEVYQSYSISDRNETIAFHFCINNKKLESNSISK